MYVGIYIYKIKIFIIYIGWLFLVDFFRGVNWSLEDIMGFSFEEFLCMEGIFLFCLVFNGLS